MVQGTAVVTLLLNLVALWKQERMAPMTAAERAAPRPSFAAAWADYARGGNAGRLLGAVALGTAAFSMQDVLLEPYGGEILGLSVSATTLLTAIWALGAIASFALAARWLAQGLNPYRMAGRGLLVGHRRLHLRDPGGPDGLAGAVLRGRRADRRRRRPLRRGDADGGHDHARAAASPGAGWRSAPGARRRRRRPGVGIAIGGGLRDVVGEAALAGRLGEGLNAPATGYSAVYNLEILLLFATLIAIGPLVRTVTTQPTGAGRRDQHRAGRLPDMTRRTWRPIP